MIPSAKFMKVADRDRFSIVPIRLPRMRWLMLGLLASILFVTPGVIRRLESSRVAESHRYLISIDEAQRQYHAIHGRYADDLLQLDLDRPEPTFFSVGALTAGPTGTLSTSWSVTLTRFGETALFGAYTMTYQNGELDWSRSTVAPHLVMSGQTSHWLTGFFF